METEMPRKIVTDWTPELDAKILKLQAEGLTQEVIAIRIGTMKHAVYRRLKHLRLREVPHEPGRPDLFLPGQQISRPRSNAS